MKKKDFIKQAKDYGVNATYSGANQTMFVSGDDAKVKSFIRIINLKGKDAKNFKLVQA